MNVCMYMYVCICVYVHNTLYVTVSWIVVTPAVYNKTDNSVSCMTPPGNGSAFIQLIHTGENGEEIFNADTTSMLIQYVPSNSSLLNGMYVCMCMYVCMFHYTNSHFVT